MPFRILAMHRQGIAPLRRRGGAVVTAGALVLVMAACGSSSKSGAPNSSGPAFTGPVPQGGTVVIGAEQEPDCFDWIGQCGGSQWGTWMAQIQTQPMAIRDVMKDGKL